MNKIYTLTNYLIILSLLVTLSMVSTKSFAFTINEAIEDAIIHNPEFRQEVKSFRAIRSEVGMAKAGYLPTIDINLGIGYEEVDRVGLANELIRREASISLTQNIFDGFATRNEVYRQESRLNSASFRAHAAANEVALQMATAYVNLFREKEVLDLAEDNLNTHVQILDQISLRFNAGIGNQVELDQARARLSLAKSNLSLAKNNYADADAKFQRVLGREISGELIAPKFTFNLPPTLVEATQAALFNHPTLLSANADVEESKAQHRASHSNNYPSLDLELEKRLDNNLSGVEGRNENLQAMLRLRFNLYNGGRDSHNIERTFSEKHRASEIRNNSRRQTIENLRFAWNANKYIVEKITHQNKHINLTYETLTGYRKQFNLGRRSLLDLLNTENEHVSANRSLINSEADKLIAQYRILSATGNLINKLGISYSFIDVKSNGER